MISKRTKIEVVGLALLMLCISIGSVYGTLLKDPPGTNPGNGFINPNYIWNSNGQSWVATGPNIQASLNLSGTTYLPAGIIYINTSLLMKDNSCLIGQGWTSIIKAGAGLGTVPLILNEGNYPPAHTNHHIEIRNLLVDGSDPNHTKSAGNNHAILFADVSWGVVDHVYVKDLGKDGVRAYNSEHISFSYVTANNTGIHSLFLGYGTTNSSISHVISYAAQKEAVCIEWPQPGTSKRNEYIQVSDVICYGNEQHGFFLQDTNYATISNYITANASSIGFYILNSSYVTLTNCQTNKNNHVNGGHGFSLTSTTNHIHLTNCIANNVASGNTAYDAYNLGGQNITLENSVGSNCGQPFAIESTARNITVSYCSFFNYGVYATIYGKDVGVSYNKFLKTIGSLAMIISVGSAARRVTVVGNDVTNAASSSRKIQDASTYAVIKDNPGFPTSYFERNGGIVPVGINGVYSAALVLAPLSQSIVGPRMYIRQIGTVATGESITYSIQTVYYTGVVKYLNKTIVGPSASFAYWYNLTDSDWFTLADLSVASGGQSLQRINVYAKTTKATTSANVRAYLLIQG